MTTGAHAEVLQNVQTHLEMIADAMRQPPHGDDAKALVQDLLRECEEFREQLQRIAHEVLQQDNGEQAFDQIARELGRLDAMQGQYQTWCASAGGAAGAHPTGSPLQSPGASAAVSRGGFGAEGMSDSGNAGTVARVASTASFESGSRKDKKAKKDKKEKKRAAGDDAFGFGTTASSEAGGAFPEAAAGSGGWPASTANESGGMGWPPASGENAASMPDLDFGSGWGGATTTADKPADSWRSSAPAQSDRGASAAGGGMGGATAGFEAGFGSLSGAGAGAAFPSSPQAPVVSAPPSLSLGGGFGDDPALGASYGGTAPGGFGVPMSPSRPARGSGPYPASSMSAGPGGCGASHHATMHIRCPFSVIQGDVDGFAEQFVRSTAQAVGVAPHRIRVRGIRPGGT